MLKKLDKRIVLLNGEMRALELKTDRMQNETAMIKNDWKEAFVDTIEGKLRAMKAESNGVAKVIREELHSNVRAIDNRWAQLRDRVQAHENAATQYKDLNETRNKNIFERLSMLSNKIVENDSPILTQEQIAVLREILVKCGA